jgi:hypothetical protein
MMCLAIIFLLAISICSFGQTVNDRRFRLAILVPDTMVIDDALLQDARALESDHVSDYYGTVKDMENRLESWKSRDSLNRFPMMKRTMQKRLDSLKRLEPEVNQYKYFYKLADYSLNHFKLMSAESTAARDFLVIWTETPSRKKFKEIMDGFNLDYLVRYSDIRALTTGNEYEMTLTTTLYSKDLKVLYTDEFKTTSKCPDDRLRCVTPLCCMLTNITKLSATKIYETVERLHAK